MHLRSLSAAALIASAVACGGKTGDNTNSGTTAKGPERGTVAEGNMTSGNDRASLTGCLATGDLPGTYVLRLAATGDSAAPGSASGVGAGTAAGTGGTAPTSGRSFRVVAESGEDLSGHVNKRVAVDGFIESASALVNRNAGQSGAAATSGAGSAVATSGTGSGSGSGSSSSADASSGTAPAMQVVRARSVRQISDECLPAETGTTR